MYFNRDYEAIKSTLLKRIPQLTDRWTDFNPTDPGMVLLELFCTLADILGYYLDTQAAEAFLTTARQRQSVIDLCSLIGYRLKRPVAATVTLRFSVAVALEQDLLIPAGIICRALTTTGYLDYETVVDKILIRGEKSVNISAWQGTRKNTQFESNGLANQLLELPGKNIAENSLRLQVNNQFWQEVSHFQESGQQSLHFCCSIDAADKTTILLGDGKNGTIPANGRQIKVDWLETAGAEGNLAANRIDQLISPIYLDKVLVSLTVTNPQAATGGAAAESLETARRQAPTTLQTLWKAVTLSDYQTLALNYPGVAKAKVLDSSNCPAIRYFKVHLAIAPQGGGVASVLLKKELAAFLEKRKTITTEIKLFDPVYRAIDVEAVVHYRPGEQPELLRSRLESCFKEWLSFDKVSFGQPAYLSDLIALLDGVSGVSHLNLIYPKEDQLLSCGEIPVSGKLTLDLRSVN